MSFRKKTVAIVAGFAVFAAVSASAASLGGVTTSDLGANSNSVKGQLANGVLVSWTTAYDATLGGYKVTGVTLAATGGETFPSTATVKLTLKDSTGASLGELSGTGSTVGSPTTTIAARDVYGVSLVVNGGTVTAAVGTTD